MVEETYTEKVLADDEEIKMARNKFLACIFLAGVDRSKYKDTTDELNSNYIRHGKPYPPDAQSMMTWVMNCPAQAVAVPDLSLNFASFQM